MKDLIFRWQTLVGSMIGAGTPLLFWFFIQWLGKYEKSRRDLMTVHKNVILAINNLLESKEPLEDFINIKIPIMMQQIDDSDDQGVYCVSRAYLPIFYTHSINENVLSYDLRSGYLINRLLKAYCLSKDLELGISDLRNQYNDTLNMQKELSIVKANSANAQNSIFRTNIIEFKQTVQDIILENNFVVYLKVLMEIKVLTGILIRDGYWMWKVKVEPSFKYFRNRKAMEEYSTVNYEKIAIYLQSLAAKEIDKLEKNK